MFSQKNVFAYFLTLGFAASPIFSTTKSTDNKEEWILISFSKFILDNEQMEKIVESFDLKKDPFYAKKIYKKDLNGYTKKEVEQALSNIHKDELGNFEIKITKECADNDTIIGNGEDGNKVKFTNADYLLDRDYEFNTLDIKIVRKNKISLRVDSKNNQKIPHQKSKNKKLEGKFENQDDSTKEPTFSQDRTEKNTYNMTSAKPSNGSGWTIFYIIDGVAFSYAIYIFFSGDMPFLKKGKQEKRKKKKRKAIRNS